MTREGGAAHGWPHPSKVPQLRMATGNDDGATSGLHPTIHSASSTSWTLDQNCAEATPLELSSFSTRAIQAGSAAHISGASYAP